MEWNDQLTSLNHYLANAIHNNDEIKRYLVKKQIPVAGIAKSNITLTYWFNILNYLRLVDRKIFDLIDAITEPNEPFANDQFLLSIKENLQIGTVHAGGATLTETAWKLDDETKEKIIGKKSTLLPINFLSKGLEVAKAVVRIRVGKSLGTGFLVKNNWVLTNNHVIKNETDAQQAVLEFNYQYHNATTGPELKADHTLALTPQDNMFFTNVANDWTLVKVQAENIAEYGYLTIAQQQPEKGDFVNIIQHPSGGAKQIALYNNSLAYIDEKILQYLTDTLPGSSGSPVFNSNWEVVALHHSGGWLKEPGTNTKTYRNEGINIQLIHQFMVDNALYEA